jgi:hypothetical protein
MPSPNPTPNEIVAALKRTRTPTVLVEGGDDMMIH